MNSKIKNYIDVLFTEVPRSKKATELKEELLSNMNDRFTDYLGEGKNETQAYGLTIASMGEVDELIAQVMPDSDFKKQATYYRKRNAKNIAIGVSMYILGAAALIGLGGLGEILGKDESYGIIGLLVLLLLAAIATGLIVYSEMSTPQEFKDYDEISKRDYSQEYKMYSTPSGKVFKAFLSIYWMIITVVYLIISFLTFAWHITWVIWPVAGILSSIITTIFELRANGHE